VETLQSYLDALSNSQVGIRLIGESEARTLTVVRAQADFVELGGLFGGKTYADGKMKKIRVPYSAIAWVESPGGL
jgi:hypothetical protein